MYWKDCSIRFSLPSSQLPNLHWQPITAEEAYITYIEIKLINAGKLVPAISKWENVVIGLCMKNRWLNFVQISALAWNICVSDKNAVNWLRFAKRSVGSSQELQIM